MVSPLGTSESLRSLIGGLSPLDHGPVCSKVLTFTMCKVLGFSLRWEEFLEAHGLPEMNAGLRT